MVEGPTAKAYAIKISREFYGEVVIWVAGCNLRYPQCQNYRITYDNVTNQFHQRR